MSSAPKPGGNSGSQLLLHSRLAERRLRLLLAAFSRHPVVLAQAMGRLELRRGERGR